MMAVKLGAKVVDALLFGPEGRRRQLQDLPGAGRRLDKVRRTKPGKPLDLLVIPTRERPTGEVVGLISDDHAGTPRQGAASPTFRIWWSRASTWIISTECLIPATSWWDQIRGFLRKPARRGTTGAMDQVELADTLGDKVWPRLREQLNNEGRRDRRGARAARIAHGRAARRVRGSQDELSAGCQAGLLLGVFISAAEGRWRRAPAGRDRMSGDPSGGSGRPDAGSHHRPRDCTPSWRDHSAAPAFRARRASRSGTAYLPGHAQPRRGNGAVRIGAGDQGGRGAQLFLDQLPRRRLGGARQRHRSHPPGLRESRPEGRSARRIGSRPPSIFGGSGRFVGGSSGRDVNALADELFAQTKLRRLEEIKDLSSLDVGARTARGASRSTGARSRQLIELDIDSEAPKPSARPTRTAPTSPGSSAPTGGSGGSRTSMRCWASAPTSRSTICRVLGSSLGDSEFAVIAALQFIRFLNEQSGLRGSTAST